MLESLISTSNISFLFVFLEGVLSFFSPCVIPLIPVYISYLAGNTMATGEDGEVTYERKKVFFHTLFFVLGISFAFFILGMSFTALGDFFNHNKTLFTRIGGMLIILLGLFQIGFLNFKFLQIEKKIHLNKLLDKKVNPLMALLMGFTFSFAWTPCVGPALSSVLIMASGAKTSGIGNMLVLLYALGFVLPFLFLGLFTTRALIFIKTKKKLLKYTIKAGGVILILMGIMTFTGWMNGVSSYLNSFTYKQESNSNEVVDDSGLEDSTKGEAEEAEADEGEEATDNSSESAETKTMPAFDFTLVDQYGEKHTLSDYKGKVVFLNFWATWCPPCRKEMPHIEELYEEYGKNQEEVIFLGVANPKTEDNPNNQDEKTEDIISFLETNDYSFPTVFDETGEIFENYYITAFPTTFMIDKEGNVFGYVPGMMTKEIMINVINQTLESGK